MLNFEHSKYTWQRMLSLEILHQILPFGRAFKSFKQFVFFVVDG